LVNVEKLEELLAREEHEKECAGTLLRELLSEVETMNREVGLKYDETINEKDELTKHLAYLKTSHAEIQASLEKETKILENEQESIIKVTDTRRSIQAEQVQNKELENEIESMTEEICKAKAALQAQTDEIKMFEAELQKLRQANDDTQIELDDEKKDLLDTTIRLQQKKEALMESKAKLENNLSQEKETFQNQIENIRMLHTKDIMKKLTKKKAKGSKKGLRVTAEAKAKDMERREQKLARRSSVPETTAVKCKGKEQVNNAQQLKRSSSTVSTFKDSEFEGDANPLLRENPLTGEVEIEAITKQRVKEELEHQVS
jgi:chromosome segregation ATPase